MTQCGGDGFKGSRIRGGWEWGDGDPIRVRRGVYCKWVGKRCKQSTNRATVTGLLPQLHYYHNPIITASLMDNISKERQTAKYKT
uniref:Uncharacterized protein n=1 Tax=Romanomermis culicivorax TaxID=13658 RepID=A0A915HYJ6_ROMCU